MLSFNKTIHSNFCICVDNQALIAFMAINYENIMEKRL